jgi:hypothetical protein
MRHDANSIGERAICDFSLHSIKTRDARVGDELVVHNFNTGTRGFAAVDDLDCAVCLKEGTELGFDNKVTYNVVSWDMITADFSEAKFTQINKDRAHTHRDALQFPDGGIVLLTRLQEGQRARVLQLPHAAEEQVAKEADAHETV